MASIPRSLHLAVSLGAFLLALPQAARAEPSPRVVVEMNGASVVLVAANQRIHAFVDRIDDNAPETEAVLGLALRGGAALALERVAPGQFVAPFVSSRRDVFLVTLEREGAASAQAVAELTPEEALAPSPAEVAAQPRSGPLPWFLAGLAALVALAAGRYRPSARAWRPMDRHAG